MAVEIREAEGKDAGLLAGLIRDSFRGVAERFNLTPENAPTHPSFCTDEWVESAMRRGIRFYVLRSEGFPRGSAAMEKADSGVCYLERLAVLPSYRRRGYGAAMVSRILNEAREAGADRVEIGVISDQVELIDWYHKLGFTEKNKARFEHLPFEVTFMFINLSRSRLQ
jgi:ribosomal protein S18 acetylase RimI-like enzyme